ncbi:UDP-3-O-(3-hydroxymyristoyl)glucosamine N-acyltransferase [Rheinheimera salexigens]|uniref:UDP-3-O-acylglucosamine N-acyltransferase n=1 Tax=Rheinheimera salexigens TaxID=1628148 RepID=A0A1E7Q8Q9_9GAMM|nr:UDP-3-O-(3-hydroxymyristoyl)glucosamine N-acyltransferase [Rheinheimera salexigens]OEY70569.1 UDP-3-O-(3-hydroxymyristoyl)glucosamine N-acyltransferase [Rheinheimera salexigens]
MTSFTLTSLAELLDAQLVGDCTDVIHSVATLQNAGPGQVSFLSNAKYRKYLAETTASVVLVTADDLPFLAPGVAALVVKDPYIAFAKVAQKLDSTPAVAINIHPTAVIDDSATIATDVAIGANAVIAAGVTLAQGVQIGAGCFIGQDANIASNTKIWPNVTVYHGVKIGENCIIHSGAIIGADGFGFANEQGNWLKIPQVGSVIIGNDCEIGANTTIDRGAIENTTVGNNVIIDNQCQIAHNVSIGDHTAMAGSTVVAGSTSIGRYCIIGGAAVINGHIEICDGAHISGMAMVMKPILEKGAYTSGIPATSNREWRKNTAKLRQIDQLYQRVKALESQFKIQLASTSADTTTEE